MTEIPERAKRPDDHRAPLSSTPPVDGGDDELLAEMPELKAAARLRIGESNKIMKLMVRVRGLLDTGEHPDYSPTSDEQLLTLIQERELVIPDDRPDGAVPAGFTRTDLIKVLEAADDELAPEIDLDDLEDDDFDKLLDMLAGVDAFAESIALDPPAYASWAEGKSMQHMMAILNRYSSAVGESNSSAS